MKKIIVSTIAICLLLTTSMVSVNAAVITHKYRYANAIITIYVDNDNIEGPWDGSYEHPYKNIQDGINNANDGDIAYVFSGTYTENLVVDKSIALRGEDKETTIIDGDFIDNTIWVNTSYVDINGFSVINSINDGWSAGIYVSESIGYPTDILTDITISNCFISNNDCGIRLGFVDGSLISNCIIYSNPASSIFILHSENVIIDNCEIFENGGILEDDWFTPGGIATCSDKVICKNIEISNCHIHNNVGQGIDIPDGGKSFKIHHNIINKNDFGLYIECASNIDINHNNIKQNNKIGIWIVKSTVSICNNMVSENGKNEFLYAGIYIASCRSSVTVEHNTISSNKKYGVLILNSSGCNIFENSFIENEKEASFDNFPGQSNSWDRNYWGRTRILPKPIFGLLIIRKLQIPIPWLNIDMHPANKPYDI